MIDLKNISLLDILPESIRHDEKVIAVAKSLDVELQKLSNQTKLPLHLPRLDELPHEVLDRLAWQYHADFYQPENMSLETKRLLIREVLHQHYKLGTKFAVEKLLNTLSRGAKVTEWWNYEGGKPYHFKINLKGLKDLEDDGERIMQAIEVAKSLRDTIDDFNFDLSKEHPDEILYFGILQLFLGKIFHDLNLNFEDKTKLKVWINGVVSGNDYFDLDFLNGNSVLNLRAGFILLESGNIKFNCDYELDDETWYELWKNWIVSRWKNWKNAIIRFYKDDEEEPIEPEEPDEEIFSGNFLKLYFDFKCSDESRLIVLPFPKDNLDGVDINAVPVENILLSRRGYLSRSIYKATLIDKKITRLFF